MSRLPLQIAALMIGEGSPSINSLKNDDVRGHTDYYRRHRLT